jgi:hypothetical protein
MERRTELRFGADQPVAVSVLTPAPSEEICGHIVEASKSGLRIVLGVPMETGTLLEVKWDGAIVRGEARYCRRAGPDRYSIGVKISEVVAHGKIKTRLGVA